MFFFLPVVFVPVKELKSMALVFIDRAPFQAVLIPVVVV